jgi:hypothetical protein
MGSIHRNVKTEESPRPYAGMGEFTGMNDFEVVAYLGVLQETAPLH